VACATVRAKGPARNRESVGLEARIVLSSLKSLLETGQGIDVFAKPKAAWTKRRPGVPGRRALPVMLFRLAFAAAWCFDRTR
jgi:hypothetical protein